jgi:RNA polymerase sigma-70 factor (ECF subfamily)
LKNLLKGSRAHRHLQIMSNLELMRPVPESLDIAAIYRAHGAQVARWAARLGGPSIDVDDVVQEVFLQAHQQIARFRGDAKITTWLYTITTRVTRRARNKGWLKRWLSGSARDAAGDLLSPRLTPVEELEQQRTATEVYRALDRLSERHRTLLILFELEGHSGEQVAELTGMRLGSVWVELHRARAAFLKQLERLDRGRTP